MKKQITKSTCWLTRRYSEEELTEMRKEAIKEVEAELEKKQIEEMAKVIDQAQKQGYQRIFEETRKFVQENHRYSNKNDYDKAHSQTIDEIIAESLYNAGYRKQKETAREILQEVKTILRKDTKLMQAYEFAQLAEKYGVEVDL